MSEAHGAEVVNNCLRHSFDLGDFDQEGLRFSKMDCYLLPRCLHNSTNLSTFIRACEARTTDAERFFVALLKLQGYVAAIEVTYIYKVIGNLLGLLGGVEEQGDLYDTAYSLRERFEDVEERAKKAAALGPDKIRLVRLMREFLDFDLRNAIGHSDYFIRASSETIIIPGYIVKAMKAGAGATKKKSVYTFKEIGELYTRATEFVEAFKAVLVQRGIDAGPRY